MPIYNNNCGSSSTGGSGIPEAPNDGRNYLRNGRDMDWVANTAPSGGSGTPQVGSLALLPMNMPQSEIDDLESQGWYNNERDLMFAKTDKPTLWNRFENIQPPGTPRDWEISSRQVFVDNNTFRSSKIMFGVGDIVVIDINGSLGTYDMTILGRTSFSQDRIGFYAGASYNSNIGSVEIEGDLYFMALISSTHHIIKVDSTGRISRARVSGTPNGLCEFQGTIYYTTSSGVLYKIDTLDGFLEGTSGLAPAVSSRVGSLGRSVSGNLALFSNDDNIFYKNSSGSSRGIYRLNNPDIIEANLADSTRIIDDVQMQSAAGMTAATNDFVIFTDRNNLISWYNLSTGVIDTQEIQDSTFGTNVNALKVGNSVYVAPDQSSGQEFKVYQFQSGSISEINSETGVDNAFAGFTLGSFRLLTRSDDPTDSSRADYAYSEPTFIEDTQFVVLGRTSGEKNYESWIYTG